MKKKLIIGGSIILTIIVILIVGVVIYYNVSLAPVGGDKIINFTIKEGTSATTVIKNLKEANLIRDELVAKISYSRCNCMFQAGEYILNSNMKMQEILEKLYSGDVVNNNIKVTFKEGIRLVDFAEVISDNFDYSKDEVINLLNDTNYLHELIDNYWFISEDILNDKLYYPLEGYLYPDTYEFDPNASIRDIVAKLLTTMQNNLNNLKNEIDSSNYSVHELLTLASIIELEAATEEDRELVSGVFYNRLNNGWSLGSDVTTYYGARKTFKDTLLYTDLENCNPYNTRSSCVSKLPVGPISSPSISALVASIKPKENEYFFFVSDSNKKVYFSKTSAEQAKVISDLKNKGMWLE